MRCPNCGQDVIDGDGIPPNYGDQLLVQKNAYEFRRPRRWEVVVLNGPVRPVPPFVKRIVGLPNEAVQIVDGDIYANGRICRKDLDEQRALRIPCSTTIMSRTTRLRAAAIGSPSRRSRPGTCRGTAFPFWQRPPNCRVGRRERSPGWRSTAGCGTAARTGPKCRSTRCRKTSTSRTAPFPQLRYDPTSRRFLLIGALDKSGRDRLLVTEHRSRRCGRRSARSTTARMTDRSRTITATTGPTRGSCRCAFATSCSSAALPSSPIRGQCIVRDRRRPPDLSPDARSLPSHGDN